MKQYFIDKFIIPLESEKEFIERMNINRAIIKQQPGFIEDNIYKTPGEGATWLYITIAVWENQEALNNAKQIVQAEYIKRGFNMPEMMQRLKITMERGMYVKV